jgi:hypothetical protein
MGSGHDYCGQRQYDHKGDCPPSRLREAIKDRQKLEAWHNMRLAKLREIYRQLKLEDYGFVLEIQSHYNYETPFKTGQIILKNTEVQL